VWLLEAEKGKKVYSFLNLPEETYPFYNLIFPIEAHERILTYRTIKITFVILSH
jgi:hypothetical protein